MLGIAPRRNWLGNVLPSNGILCTFRNSYGHALLLLLNPRLVTLHLAIAHRFLQACNGITSGYSSGVFHFQHISLSTLHTSHASQCLLSRHPCKFATTSVSLPFKFVDCGSDWRRGRHHSITTSYAVLRTAKAVDTSFEADDDSWISIRRDKLVYKPRHTSYSQNINP